MNVSAYTLMVKDGHGLTVQLRVHMCSNIFIDGQHWTLIRTVDYFFQCISCTCVPVMVTAVHVHVSVHVNPY